MLEKLLSYIDLKKALIAIALYFTSGLVPLLLSATTLLIIDSIAPYRPEERASSDNNRSDLSTDFAVIIVGDKRGLHKSRSTYNCVSQRASPFVQRL